MNIKKTLVLMLAFLMIVGALAGCGKTETPTPETNEVEQEVVLELAELNDALGEAEDAYERALTKVQEAEEDELEANVEELEDDELGEEKSVVEEDELEEVVDDTEELVATDEEELVNEDAELVNEDEEEVVVEEVPNRLSEALTELGNTREDLDVIKGKVENEEYTTQEEVDTDLDNVRGYIEILNAIEEEFTFEVHQEVSLTIVNELDKAITEIVMSAGNNEKYGENILVDRVLGTGEEYNTEIYLGENGEETWFAKITLEDGEEIELNPVNIIEDTTVKIVVNSETEELELVVVE